MVRRWQRTSFMAGRLDVVVATITFGLGLDKPDVRYGIHTCMASSMVTHH